MIFIYFTVYYIFPWLIQSMDISLGFFDRYFSGKVQNPAIAAATAILLSVLAGLAVHYLRPGSGKKAVTFKETT